jgi:hypothetical protein
MSYKGVINKERNNNKDQLKYIDLCNKLLNKKIDICDFMENTPFHTDALFKFDIKNNYKIDIGHYLFKTVLMLIKLNKTKDLVNIIDNSINFINYTISCFKKTPTFNTLVNNHKQYTIDNTKKILYINNFCNNIVKIDNLNIKMKFIIEYIFSINIINHYKKQKIITE